jgi:quercetin dioxygenase-like cupin family protein
MQFVFDTTQVQHYHFPTHVNELVLDRSNAQTSEVFIVVLDPGEAPPLHRHDDTEQIFYILEGRGTLTTGTERTTHGVKPGDVVRIPPSTQHSIQAVGEERLKYVAVDCFVNGCPPDEPTWEDHVKVVCRQQDWNFDEVVTKE